MSDSLLRSLRDQVVDETNSLAGLLRKCLMLGAVTGSHSLREWARRELYGYEDVGASDMPTYRRVVGVPLQVSGIIGASKFTDMPYSRLEVPESAREYLTEFVVFRESIDELEAFVSNGKSVSFVPGAMGMIRYQWNQHLGYLGEIHTLYYKFGPATFRGVLGHIRTQLVELVGALTAAVPMEELPDKAQVDSAMNRVLSTTHVGEINVTGVAGAVAIGAASSATSGDVTLGSVRSSVDAIRDAAAGLSEKDREEVETLAQAADIALAGDLPDTATALAVFGQISRVAKRLGSTALTAAVTSAAAAATQMLLGG